MSLFPDWFHVFLSCLPLPVLFIIIPHPFIVHLKLRPFPSLLPRLSRSLIPSVCCQSTAAASPPSPKRWVLKIRFPLRGCHVFTPAMTFIRLSVHLLLQGRCTAEASCPTRSAVNQDLLLSRDSTPVSWPPLNQMNCILPVHPGCSLAFLPPSDGA